MKVHFYAGLFTAILCTLFLALEVVDASVVPSTWTSPGKWPNALGSYADLWDPTGITTDFWDKAMKLGLSAQKYTENILHDATITYASTTSQINEFKTSMAYVISDTSDFRSKLESRGISLEKISQVMALELSKLVEEIKKEFPPPDHAEHHVERVQVVSRVLEKIGNAVVRVCVSVGIPEDEARANFKAVEPHILQVLSVTGDLAEQHPLILETLLVSGVMLVIPEMWLLRPIFGLFGFGPAGTVKGSIAAGAQRRFFGAAIPKGSWFSHLQSASTRYRLPPGMGQKIGAGVGAGVGIGLGFLGGLFSCGGRR